MRVVSNTSPIWNLASIRRLDLLREQWHEVLIPAEVLAELQMGSGYPETDRIRVALDAQWIRVTPLTSSDLKRSLMRELDVSDTFSITFCVITRMDMKSSKIWRVMMANAAYLQAQHLIENLSPPDQARLLTYLSCRLTQLLSAQSVLVAPTAAAPETAWQEFFRAGDNIMRSDRPESETLTAAVLAMRR